MSAVVFADMRSSCSGRLDCLGYEEVE